MKLIIAGLVVVSVTVILLWFLSRESLQESSEGRDDLGRSISQPNETVPDKPIPIQKKQHTQLPSLEFDSVDTTLETIEKESVDNQSAPRTIESAMNSMREALISGDDRTPELREPQEIIQPTLEELNDPELYQQYEERQEFTRAGAYFSSSSREISAFRSKIEQARRSGSRTDDEIREAEEALEKMEQLRSEIEWELPDEYKGELVE